MAFLIFSLLHDFFTIVSYPEGAEDCQENIYHKNVAF